MQQYLPKDAIRWTNDDLDVENIIREVENINEKSLVGMVLKVDVTYPQFLHHDHKDLPYLPEKRISHYMESFPNLCRRYSQKINMSFTI